MQISHLLMIYAREGNYHEIISSYLRGAYLQFGVDQNSYI